MPTLRNKNVRGDHYITLVVDIPTKLTNEQKEALAVYDKLLTGEEKHIKKKGFLSKINLIYKGTVQRSAFCLKSAHTVLFMSANCAAVLHRCPYLWYINLL